MAFERLREVTFLTQGHRATTATRLKSQVLDRCSNPRGEPWIRCSLAISFSLPLLHPPPTQANPVVPISFLEIGPTSWKLITGDNYITLFLFILFYYQFRGTCPGHWLLLTSD